MVSYFAARTTAYSLILVFTLPEIVFGVLSLPPFQASTRSKLAAGWFNGLALVAAPFTLAWACVLLAYNNRPLSKHPLCTAKSHVISNLVIASLWLLPVISILLTIGTPFVCTDDPGDFGPVLCGFTATTMTSAWIIFGNAAWMVFLIRNRSRILGFQTNIAEAENLQLLERP